MTIKGNSIGTVVFDKLFLKSFSFTQNIATNALKRVDFITKIYGEKDGEKVFDNKDTLLSIKDFDGVMVEMLIADGIAPEDIPAHVAAAKVAAADMSIAEVMAAFRVGVAKVLKHFGKFDYTSVE